MRFTSGVPQSGRLTPRRNGLYDQRPLTHLPANADVIVEGAQEGEVHDTRAHTHPRERQSIDSSRQARVHDPQSVLERIRLQPEQADERVGHGGGGPRLGTARHRVADRLALARTAFETGVQLRQAMSAQTAGGIVERCEQLPGFAVAAVMFEPRQDQRVVVRPDAAQLVAERVETLLATRERSDAPAAEHILLPRQRHERYAVESQLVSAEKACVAVEEP